MKVLYTGFFCVACIYGSGSEEILKAQLKVRVSQVAAKNALIHLQQVQSDPVYRKALAEAEITEAAFRAEIAELGKVMGCEIDPSTVECKAAPETSSK